jgi:hypothetical protein
MVEPLRHRQTKGAATDMPGLPPPRHFPTLPFLRLSPRRIRYHRGTVKNWLLERAHRSTSQYADPAVPRSGRAPGSRLVDGRVVPPDAAD